MIKIISKCDMNNIKGKAGSEPDPYPSICWCTWTTDPYTGEKVSYNFKSNYVGKYPEPPID